MEVSAQVYSSAGVKPLNGSKKRRRRKVNDRIRKQT
jgi:hypothetical protein